MIHVNGLFKSYADLQQGPRVALGGISFTAKAGEIFGLLGPNGAGKTTALRILSTVLVPTGGSASVNGFDVLTQPASVRRQIGLVSCNTAVYDRMTAWEMVEYFGRLDGLANDLLRERMNHLFECLQMQDIRDVLGAKMSTGMKQKVSIARALVHDPPVLIFDEATAGLDVLVARALLKTVSQLRDLGKCIIFSTHIMREAERLCDRIAIMHRGKIITEGTQKELAAIHAENDLEELFFRLINLHSDKPLAAGLLHPDRRQSITREREPPMSWANIKLIYLRELRDQLRDRRTLFMIVVLPLLMYPLLAMVWCQMQQFLKERPSKVLVVGAEGLPQQPPLLEPGDDALLARLFAKALCTESEAQLLSLQLAERPLELTVPAELAQPREDIRAEAERQIAAGVYHAVIYFPPDFAHNIARFRREKNQIGEKKLQVADLDQVPQPEILVDSASDGSRVAMSRLDLVLRRWREAVVQDNLRLSDIPLGAARPFEVVNTDVAESFRRRAALWSKVLPFVVLVWALTGAFYPAVDLCAGEKERGTLETLLVSPAQRGEIVWGKLLTVMTFSVTTSLLNLICMGLTGSLFFMQMAGSMSGPLMLDLGPPPISSLLWLSLALLPIASLFSALALAIAAFARSTKEGQYYLMPLLLITMPLMVLPLLPQVQLDLGFSLIPVTGVMLLLRALMEGEYLETLRYSPFVIGITGLCCWLSMRWAIRQFNSESVLFRESERFGVGLWLRHLIRDRQDTPSPAEAIACGILLLVLRFVGSFTIPMPRDWSQFAIITVVVQVALIATPACLMAIMLTRKPRKTLLLQAPSYWTTLPAAALVAVLLHPALMWLAAGIREVYPLSPDTLRALAPLESMLQQATLPELLLLVALTPAICEELAFRGFILSGLRRMGHKWTAIAICSVLFGVAHGLLQQSLAATVVGLVIGYIAVKTNSLLPAMAYHFVHNSLGVLHGQVTPELLQEWAVLDAIFICSPTEGATYRWPAMVIAALCGALVLLWIKRLPYHPCAEERLQDAIARQTPLVSNAAYSS